MSNEDNHGLEPAEGIETVPYHKYHRDQVKASKLIPGLAVRDSSKGKMTCPRCSYEQDGLDHLEERECPKCRPKMKRAGASLKLIP